MVFVVWHAPNVLLLQMCSLFCAVKLGKAISGKKCVTVWAGFVMLKQ